MGVFFIIFFVNFRLAVRYIGNVSRSAVDKFRARRIDFGLYRKFRDGSPWVAVPLSLVLSIIICIPLIANWEQFLLYLNMPSSGLTDPAFGRDISYYIGALPIYRMIYGRLFIAFAVAFAAVLGIYLYENRIFRSSELEFTRGEKRHLGVLFGILVLIGFWHFLLDRFSLLLETRNLPVFRGPGHVEMTWMLTFIWTAALSTLALGAALIWAVSRKKRFWVPGIFALLIAAALAGRYSEGIRNLVNRLRVEPNELALQAPYIQNNIDATLAAFDLENVEVREYAPVDVGRYPVDGSEQQVFLSAREIDITEIPAERQSYHYEGSGGVPIDTVFRQLVFWTYFKEPDLFFSTRFSPESRILYRRNVVDRISKLVPFLTLDSDPYLIADEDGLYWMIDAYTVSKNYPYGASASIGDSRINYLRNSVKIVVDAYHGTADFYISDPKDPLIRAYADFYSMLFKPLDEMPESIRAHMRYPRDLFAAQMEIYADYHQSDADVFYRASDVWEPAPTPLEDTERISPRYITADLIETDRLDYSLVLPMVPKGRQNLRAIAVAGADPGTYGRIMINNFPRGELVFGFAQVDALINEEPAISEQFTLWGQEGSKIVQGGIIALPLGPRMLYIEPVFLQAAEGPAVPQLERVIISEGTMAVMGESLGDAYEKLLQRIESEEGPR